MRYVERTNSRQTSLLPVEIGYMSDQRTSIDVHICARTETRYDGYAPPREYALHLRRDFPIQHVYLLQRSRQSAVVIVSASQLGGCFPNRYGRSHRTRTLHCRRSLYETKFQHPRTPQIAVR